MSRPEALKSVETYKARVREFAARGWIDPLVGLKGDRVYLFTSRTDSVVNPETVHRAAQLYLSLGVAERDLKLVDGLIAGHTWVTANFGRACDANMDPYINDCGYDQAEAILQHIYGELKPHSGPLSGKFVKFDQTEFAPDRRPVENGLNEVGYLYVPKACEPGSDATCALHVASHGCMQSAEHLGDVFYKHIGVNEWADSNDIIVLYPQAHTISSRDFAKPQMTDLFAINPAGCWNWFGYAYDDHFMVKDGVQVTAIYNMVRRVIGEN